MIGGTKTKPMLSRKGFLGMYTIADICLGFWQGVGNRRLGGSRCMGFASRDRTKGGVPTPAIRPYFSGLLEDS